MLVAVNNLDGSQSFEEYEMKTMTKIKEKHFGGGVVSLKYYSNSTLIGIKTLGGVKSVFLFDLNKNQLKKSTKQTKHWVAF